MSSKHIAASTTNQLGAGVVFLAAFNIYQDYAVSGIAGIGESDVMLLISGLGIIINRIKAKTHQQLHVRKPKVDTL